MHTLIILQRVALAACVLVTNVATDLVRGVAAPAAIVSADLELTAATATATPTPLLVGRPVTYTLGITNRGPVTATNTTLTGVFDGLEALTVVPLSTNCTLSSNSLTCVLGNLSPGAGVRFEVTARPPRVGPTYVSFSAYSDTREINPGNNQSDFSAFAVVAATRFESPAPIIIPSIGSASPYPSVIPVSGLTSRVAYVTITLHSLTHSSLHDLDVLLVSPSGRAITLLSDVGGTNSVANVTLTLDDLAPLSFPEGEPVVPGRYVPTDLDTASPPAPEEDVFPSPAPMTVPGSSLSLLNDGNPNGNWWLYVVADTNGRGGVIAGGWSVVLGTDDRDLIDYVTVRGIVATGQPVDSSSGSNFFGGQSFPTINNAGVMAFAASVLDESFTDRGYGLWTSAEGERPRRLAFHGDPAPGLTGSVFNFASFDDAPVALNDAGVVAFRAPIFDTNDVFDFIGILAGGSANTLAPIAVSGGTAPGETNSFLDFSDFGKPSINAAGTISFFASVADLFSGESYSGIYSGSNRTSLALLAREGLAAPGEGPRGFLVFAELSSGGVATSDSGQMAFAARAADSVGATLYGVWVGRSVADLRAVALSFQIAPGLPHDAHFNTNDFPVVAGMTASGRAVFTAEASDDLGGVTRGIWAGASAEDLELLVAAGQQLALGAQDVTMQDFGVPRVGPGGEILFVARFIEAASPTEDRLGLWRRSADGLFTLIARDGSTVRGLPADTTLSLDPSFLLNGFLNRAGQAALILPVTGPTFYQAVFGYDPRVGLVTVLGAGAVVETAPGVFRELGDIILPSEFSCWGGQDGRSPFNDAGELALRVSFVEGDSGLIVAQLGCATVGDGVFYDRNANGRRDPDEPGVPDVRVDLFDPGPAGQPGGGDDTLVGTRLTDGDGRYHLGVLRAGNYYLHFHPPLGFAFTARDQGGDDTLDSDVDPAPGLTSVFLLNPGQRDTTRDAGLVSGLAVFGGSVVEGNSGLQLLPFTVQLGVPKRSPVSVAFATANGTARAGVDFLSTNGVLTFSPGERSKTFFVPVLGETAPESGETVLMFLINPVGASIVGPSGVGTILNDDPLPPAPSDPRPLHRSILQPLNTFLSWIGSPPTNLVVNGSFETGDLTGWNVTPPGPDFPGYLIGQDALFFDQYYAYSNPDLTGIRTLSQDISIPTNATFAFVAWWYSLSSDIEFSDAHYFRVEVRDLNDQSLSVLFQTNPSEDRFPGLRFGFAILDAFRGRTIRLAFITRSEGNPLAVALDGIRLNARLDGDTYDVYFGTNPQPGPVEFQGNSSFESWGLPSLQPVTTYYWQIVTRRGEASVPGPVWRFTTRLNVTNAVPRVVASLTSISIPAFSDDGVAQPYPSTITLSSLVGQVAEVGVTLHGLSHRHPEDLDVLLVSPTGRAVLLMSDAGSSNAINGVTLTFDDDAPAPLPRLGPLASGTWRPANYEGYSDEFLPPAPPEPYRSTLSALNGSNPNGTWSLYVIDHFGFEDGGVIAGGWTLSLTLFYGDTDLDGLPDDYELAHDFNPLNPFDAGEDADGDGDRNVHEFLAGTDPFDGSSVLRITGFRRDGNDTVIEFMTGTGHRYRVERMDNLNMVSGVVGEFPGTGELRSIRDVGGATRPRRFYRISVQPE